VFLRILDRLEEIIIASLMAAERKLEQSVNPRMGRFSAHHAAFCTQN